MVKNVLLLRSRGLIFMCSGVKSMGKISSQSPIKSAFILFPARALHAMSMDVLLTSIPQIQSSLSISQASAQLVISAFVLATSISHLFIGPLADKFGRRPVMLVSTVIFIIGSWICAISEHITQLILARVLQGIGSCGTTIGILAILRDVFEENERAKISSYLNGITSLSPLLAPSIGAFLLFYFGSWQANFHFLIWFGILSFVLCFFYLQETKPLEQSIIYKRNIVSEYWQVLSNRTFLCYVIPGVSALVTLLMFFSVSSILVIDILKESNYKLALLFASNALVYMIASFIAPLLLSKWKLSKCIAIGSFVMMFGSLMLIIAKFIFPLSLWIIFIPNYLQTFGSGLIFGNSVSGALEPFKHNAGIAAATYGFMQYGLASIIAATIMMFEINSMILPALTMLMFGVVNVLLMRVRGI
jgi:DHA1 family florfenicol/chloramphenicol resistance protein-like MFS transporter